MNIDNSFLSFLSSVARGRRKAEALYKHHRTTSWSNNMGATEPLL